MPRPMPDWVPSPVREIILTEHGNLKAFAAAAGLPYSTFVNGMRENDHEALIAFNEAAARLGVEPDELAPITEARPEERRAFLEKLLNASITHIKDLSYEGEKDHYLYALLLGRVGNPIRRFYHPVCRELRLSLREFEGAVRAARA